MHIKNKAVNCDREVDIAQVARCKINLVFSAGRC